MERVCMRQYQQEEGMCKWVIVREYELVREKVYLLLRERDRE